MLFRSVSQSRYHQANDIVVFCDIDAFPLSRQAYLNAVAHAEQGAVFGLAQFSNHKKTQDVYAGPMFMAFRKDCWEALGKPGTGEHKVMDRKSSKTASRRGEERDTPPIEGTVIGIRILARSGRRDSASSE